LHKCVCLVYSFCFLGLWSFRLFLDHIFLYLLGLVVLVVRYSSSIEPTGDHQCVLERRFSLCIIMNHKHRCYQVFEECKELCLNNVFSDSLSFVWFILTTLTLFCKSRSSHDGGSHRESFLVGNDSMTEEDRENFLWGTESWLRVFVEVDRLQWGTVCESWLAPEGYSLTHLICENWSLICIYIWTVLYNQMLEKRLIDIT